MRIDFVITELFVGGAEKCLTELAIGLHTHGDDVRVFSIGSLPSGEKAPTGEKAALVDRLRSNGIAVTSANADGSAHFFSAQRRLTEWLRESPPDVCQSFLFHANCLSALTARRAGARVLVGGLRVAESHTFRCFLERRAVKKMNRVVCVSNAVADFAAVHLGCDADRAVVIPNGVDFSRYKTANFVLWSDITGWPDESDVVLFVGRFHPQKGLELIRSRIDQIAPVGTNRRMLFVGDGPLRSDLETWAESVGKARCRVLPWQSDVAPLMKSARVLVLPSHYEGMPNVVLEAMATGIPVVCSLVEGSEELLSHQRDTQGFPPGNADQMVELIDALVSDPELAQRIGQSNQQRVRVDFSIPTMVDSYRRLYRDLAQ